MICTTHARAFKYVSKEFFEGPDGFKNQTRVNDACEIKIDKNDLVGDSEFVIQGIERTVDLDLVSPTPDIWFLAHAQRISS